MKRILSLVVMAIMTVGILVAQPVTPPPDVYLQWQQTSIPILNTANQDIAITLPTNNISRYSFHYVYLFFKGACVTGDVSTLSTGNITGTVPTIGGSTYNVNLGGLINQTFTQSGGGTGPVLILKGNGAVTSLGATVHLYSITPASLSSCTIDVLYKGTVKEEEGYNSVGIYAPSKVAMVNVGTTPTVTVGASTTLYDYSIPAYGTSTHRANVGIEQITACVFPSATGGVSGTTPVGVTAYIAHSNGNLSNLGSMVLTNNCYTIGPQAGNMGVAQAGDVVHIWFRAANTSVYTYGGGNDQLVATIYGNLLY